MSTLIIPVSLTEIITVSDSNCSANEEEQLAFDEQLMLDRQAYYQEF